MVPERIVVKGNKKTPLSNFTLSSKNTPSNEDDGLRMGFKSLYLLKISSSFANAFFGFFVEIYGFLEEASPSGRRIAEAGEFSISFKNF